MLSNIYVTAGTDYELPEVDEVESKHVGRVVKIIPTRCNNCVFIVRIGPLSGRHDAEHQDSDYLQLHTTHTDRTTLLRTNSLTKCARLPVAIYSTCTPDDGWYCHPKHLE